MIDVLYKMIPPEFHLSTNYLLKSPYDVVSSLTRYVAKRTPTRMLIDDQPSARYDVALVETSATNITPISKRRG